MSVQRVVLAQRPQGLPDASTFRTETHALPPLGQGDVQVKPLYFSVDPYMRGRMNAGKSYVPPFEIDAPIVGGGLATVVQSNSDFFRPGDTVGGTLPWATEAVVPATELKRIDPSLGPLTYHLGLLGMPGLTAYFGLLDIGKPKPGETVVVSGAAGAVGLVVGQLAKIHGCRVVGIAGSDAKVTMLQEAFGFDAGINYKTVTSLPRALAEVCPKGIDVYFDNVGGAVSDAALGLINKFGRIPLCGQIALYNSQELPMGPRPQPLLLTRSALMQGFIVFNYQDRYGEAMKALAGWLKEGKLKYTETVMEGFENLPRALLGLFAGDNQGKMIVKV